MAKFIHKIVHSPVFKIILRFFAGLASAIVVISGFLYIMNLEHKNKNGEIVTSGEPAADEPEADGEHLNS